MGRRVVLATAKAAAEAGTATKAVGSAEIRGRGGQREVEGGGQEGQEGGFQELELDQAQVPQKETT